ncbi:Ger(x)C family spore germination protein [Virgibacillus halodenitrificans]|uniref:Ger(x)C family spore germination protein n=1 Tax=Virgibacillus halodenitrificans TaxID=1482 RepID=UPI0013701E63|nr:Ger(x)C family spore germination protein [Virgibacillus halodenitrificans]MYL46879.1 Ger(x)C family spore germination protein [Virgibacillus halodenitrificans]
MKIKLITYTFIICLFLTGCFKENQIEKMGIINARGIDKQEDGLIQASLVLFQFEAQAKDITKLVKGTGNSTKGAINNANLETNFLLDSGKLQMELYGKETAQEGISPYLDTLLRDARVPDTSYMAIGEPTAEDILTVQESGISMNIGQYLHGVIENSASDKLFPKVSLVTFSRLKNDIGVDPILPVFELKEGIPKITNIAAFQDDKYVGNISIENKILFNFLNESLLSEWLEVTLPFEPFKKYKRNSSSSTTEKLHVALNTLRNDSTIRVTDLEDLTFKINLNIEASLLEISNQIKLEDKRVLKLLEKEIEKNIENKYEQLLKKLQELNSDAMGLGAVYRYSKKGKPLTKAEWRKKFPEVKADFNVTLKINQHGETF